MRAAGYVKSDTINSHVFVLDSIAMKHKSSGHVLSLCGSKYRLYTEGFARQPTTGQGELNAAVESFFSGTGLPVYFHQFCPSFWTTRELIPTGKWGQTVLLGSKSYPIPRDASVRVIPEILFDNNDSQYCRQHWLTTTENPVRLSTVCVPREGRKRQGHRILIIKMGLRL